VVGTAPASRKVEPPAPLSTNESTANPGAPAVKLAGDASSHCWRPVRRVSESRSTCTVSVAIATCARAAARVPLAPFMSRSSVAPPRPSSVAREKRREIANPAARSVSAANESVPFAAEGSPVSSADPVSRRTPAAPTSSPSPSSVASKAKSRSQPRATPSIWSPPSSVSVALDVSQRRKPPSESTRAVTLSESSRPRGGRARRQRRPGPPWSRGAACRASSRPRRTRAGHRRRTGARRRGSSGRARAPPCR
jgi:hypothetical protein